MTGQPGNLILETRNLCYSYDDKTLVLKNVNLGIKKGEKIAVLGPNGAGKSTLFLNINGVYKGSGEIYLHGKKIGKKNINELRKSAGYVFQEPDSQIVGSTVMGEISFGLMNLKLPVNEIKKRTKQVLNKMELSRYKDRPPHYLSGGEKKRVSIAGVVVMQPEIILFDEPSASLDHPNVIMLEEMLSELGKEGKTLVVSTHDVDFAYKWAERIIVFAGGEIIADDTPVNIFTSEEILKKAGLSKPVLLQVYEIIKEKSGKKARDYSSAPRCINEFKEWFGSAM